MSKNVRAAVGKFKFKGFENVEFTDGQKKSILIWLDNFGEQPLDAAVVLVEADYKIGIGYDAYHGVNHVTLTCKDQSSKYYGYCFTLKHADLGKALLIFRYLYDHYFKDEVYEVGSNFDKYDW